MFTLEEFFIRFLVFKIQVSNPISGKYFNITTSTAFLPLSMNASTLYIFLDKAFQIIYILNSFTNTTFFLF